MTLLRKLLFYIFLGIYLVGCPLTVLYALGYLFRPGAEQGIVKTGLIYLSSSPPGASIYVGKRRYTKKTPVLLQDLLPGDYAIRLSLQGYQPWVRTVPVEAEKATVLERVLLLPEPLEGRAVVSEAFRELIPIPKSDTFLLSTGPTLADMVVYNWKEAQVRPLLPAGSVFQEAKLSSVMAVEESAAALLRVDMDWKTRFLWVELKGKEPSMEDLTDLFVEPPVDVEWDPRDQRHLFAFHNGQLSRLDVVSKAIYPNFLERVRGYGLANRSLYVLDQDYRLRRTTTEGREEEVLLSDPVLGRFLFGDRGLFKIRPFSKDVLLFLGERGELLSNRLPYRLVEKGVLGLEISPRRERVLVWRRDRLGVLDFSERQKEEGVFERGPELFWVYKEGRNITQAFWVFDGSHILFRDEDQIFLLELETYGPPSLHELVRSKRKSPVCYSEEAGTLFYLDRDTAALSALTLLPKRELLSLPIPVRLEERRRGEIQAQ